MWKLALSICLLALPACSIPESAAEPQAAPPAESASITPPSSNPATMPQEPSSPTPAQPQAFWLEDHQWQNRILLVFAPSEQHPDYQQQLQQMAGQEAEISERELLVVHSLASGSSRLVEQPLDGESSDRLRQQFGITPDEFAVILIGKDGTQKRQERSPVSLTTIFDQIDGMPMRQREILEQGQS